MSDDCGKYEAFDQTRDHVAQSDRSQYIVEVQQGREPRAKEHEQPARENTEEIGDDTQTRNADQGGQVLRRKDELNRFERHHSQRVEFLSHFHGPNLSRKCRTRTPADCNCRQQGAEFPRETDRNQINDIVQGSEVTQLRGSLHRQDESTAHRHQGNHRERVNPDL